MPTNIVIPNGYIVQDCYPRHLTRKITRSHRQAANGILIEVFNLLGEKDPEVGNIYITICNPNSTKGPHMHEAPKIDRFMCVDGMATLVTRNEQTKLVKTWPLVALDILLIIPPYNSHMIVSQEGCTILNICSEVYDPSKPYNQIETSREGMDSSLWQNS